MYTLDTIFTRERSKSLRSISVSVRIAKRISLVWSEIFKGRMSEDLTFGYYKKFTLGIYTTNFCWVNEIPAHKKMIIKTIEDLLNHKGVVKYIKVHHMPEIESQKEDELAKANYNNSSFEAKIQKENELKRLRGDRLCATCKVVYTKAGTCVFCDTQ